MLKEIIGAAVACVIGYNALKDEESRVKTKSFIEKMSKSIDKKMQKNNCVNNVCQDSMESYRDIDSEEINE